MSSESPLWDIRGWKRLTVHEKPQLVGARQEFFAWPAEVPEDHRTDLDARLRSDLDYAHLPARLELFVHHYFLSHRWEVQIHPSVTCSPNRPDFFAKNDAVKLLVECRSIFDQHAVGQQSQRLHHVAEDVGRRLGRAVILHPLSNLPPNIPSGRVRSWIEQQPIPDDGPDLLEFDFWSDHQGHHFGVRVIIPKLDAGGERLTGVQGLMSQGQTIANVQRLREALKEKASKYGMLHLPYVIAVSGETWSPMNTKHEVDALFGDRVWNIPKRGLGTVTETRNANGFFNMHRNNIPRYRHVSAVLVYRFKWLDKAHVQRMHIYHNPFADKTIAPVLFPHIPQFLQCGETTMGWINGEPEPY